MQLIGSVLSGPVRPKTNAEQDKGISTGEYYQDDGRYTHDNKDNHKGNWGKHPDKDHSGQNDSRSSSGSYVDTGSLGGY